MSEQVLIKPQPRQAMALRCNADVLVFGGCAGGGKSFTILMEPLRHIGNPGFRAVFFRKNYALITNPGGLWDESAKIYPLLGGVPNQGKMQWKFPSGATITFRHVQYEDEVENYRGAQFALLLIDEATEFTERTFWFLLSRNRTTCGVRPYCRLTCNPDPDHFLARLLSWWINQDTGYAIAERSGVVRYFLRLDEVVHWGNTREELVQRFPGTEPASIKAFSFILSKLHDNQALLRTNPEYLGTLMAMPLVDRERLLNGNWKIRARAGNVFKEEWLNQFVDASPVAARRVRYWDRAATKGGGAFTSGTRMSLIDGIVYVEDVLRGQLSPYERDKMILGAAQKDRALYGEYEPTTWYENDGMDATYAAARLLAGYPVRSHKPQGNKVFRAGPFASQCEAGNVRIVRGAWNQAYIDELVNFPTGEFMDQTDSSSGAYNRLVTASQGIDGDVLCYPAPEQRSAEDIGWSAGAGWSPGASEDKETVNGVEVDFREKQWWE